MLAIVDAENAHKSTDVAKKYLKTKMIEKSEGKPNFYRVLATNEIFIQCID